MRFSYVLFITVWELLFSQIQNLIEFLTNLVRRRYARGIFGFIFWCKIKSLWTAKLLLGICRQLILICNLFTTFKCFHRIGWCIRLFDMSRDSIRNWSISQVFVGVIRTCLKVESHFFCCISRLNIFWMSFLCFKLKFNRLCFLDDFFINFFSI